LRPRDTGHERERGGARGMVQELAARLMTRRRRFRARPDVSIEP